MMTTRRASPKSVLWRKALRIFRRRLTTLTRNRILSKSQFRPWAILTMMKILKEKTTLLTRSTINSTLVIEILMVIKKEEVMHLKEKIQFLIKWSHCNLERSRLFQRLIVWSVNLMKTINWLKMLIRFRELRKKWVNWLLQTKKFKKNVKRSTTKLTLVKNLLLKSMKDLTKLLIQLFHNLDKNMMARRKLLNLVMLHTMITLISSLIKKKILQLNYRR